jgi:tight adherence protein B
LNPTLITLLAAVLGFIAVAGFGLALTGQGSSSARTVKRAQTIVGRDGRDSGGRRKIQASPQEQRRKQILKTLREQDRQAKKATLSLSAKLLQAGLSDNTRGFWIISGVVGAVTFLILLFLHQQLLVALGAAFAAGFGLPRWVLGFLGSRRTKKFTGDFPDAMDIVVRGIKSGMPVNDSLRIIGNEAAQPLAGEFKRLTEALGMGLGMDQALEKMYERMPTQEVRFFAIVLAIQAKTGGNLAEALGNLSTVIRARKLMREKIKALSGEAVASAIIIGSLPPAVVTLISFTSPTYMAPMFTDHRGHVMLLMGAGLMAFGIFVMRKMINFKI